MILRGILGGILGGMVGAAAWTLATALSGTQVGLGLWLVGLLTGVGVALGTGRRGSSAAGAVAVLVALGAVAAGSAAGAAWSGEETVRESETAYLDEAGALMRLERDIQTEWAEQGRVGAIAEDRITPQEVRTEAARQWGQMSESDRLTYMTMLHQAKRDAGTSAIGARLGGLGLIDVLWFVLALATAFKVAAHARPGEEEAPSYVEYGEETTGVDDLSSASWGRRVVQDRGGRRAA